MSAYARKCFRSSGQMSSLWVIIAGYRSVDFALIRARQRDSYRRNRRRVDFYLMGKVGFCLARLMTRFQKWRPAACFVMLEIICGTCGVSAQPVPEIRREASRLDDLINEGKYADATKLASAVLDRLHLWQRDDQALAFLAYLGKAAVETGRLGQAFKILNSAETLSSNLWDKYYEPALFREKAALHYAAAEYDIAAQVAAKAYRLSEERNYFKIRAAYCQSIEGLALLRQGNLSEAERVVLNAVKAAPKKPGKSPVFAPRILYSACLVESHAGKIAAADAFCQRGLQIAVLPKLENRDLSLGYLALAEARLQAGDLVASREAALKSADLTARLFGTEHQDMVDALNLLAQISLKEGDVSAARAHVNKAIKIATALFGDGSPGAGIPARTLLDIEKKGSEVRQ